MTIAKTLIAKEVLRIIKENPRITPSEMADKIDVTAQYVRNTLGTLAELNLVETPVRGVYLITELGDYVLSYLEKEKSQGS